MTYDEMRDAPCADCKKRYVGCHSDCEDYKAWKSKQMIVAENKRKAKAEQSMLDSYTAKSVRKYMRKKREER